MFEIRTDLALEVKEHLPKEDREIQGVTFREWGGKNRSVKMTEVEVLNAQGEKSMGKAKGIYLTMEARNLQRPDEDYHREVSEELCGQLKRMAEGLQNKGELPKKRLLRILVVGLGNALVTPDALGPLAVENLAVEPELLSGIAPGVTAQTGMETADILRGIVGETEPDLIIAIDALAARSIRRLGTTIQLTDTGIQPGSGVGNHRHSLTKESLGVPVLAIGVPTVVGAAAIVHDTVSALVGALASGEKTKAMGAYVEQLGDEEQYQLIRELLEPEFGSLYMTPPDIDRTVKRMSYTISEAIHMAFRE